MYVHGFGTHNDNYAEPAPIDYAPAPAPYVAPKLAPAPPPVYKKHKKPLYVPPPAPAPPPG